LFAAFSFAFKSVLLSTIRRHFLSSSKFSSSIALKMARFAVHSDATPLKVKVKGSVKGRVKERVKTR
jgi:hypothetical protein